MGDQPEIEKAKAIQESAKAVSQVAKTTGEILASVPAEVGKAGAYMTRFVHQPAVDWIGLKFGDSLASRRRLHQFELQLQEYVQKRKLLDRYVPLDERSFVPLIEAVSIETDEALQDVWAAYVANAMDPDQPVVSLNRQLISVIRNLEPSDLMLFKRLTSDWSDKATAERLVLRDGDFETPLEGLEASMARLSGLGLFAFTSFNEVPWTIKRDAEEFLNVEICVEARGRFRPTPLFGLLYRSVWGLKMERSSPSQTSEA